MNKIQSLIILSIIFLLFGCENKNEETMNYISSNCEKPKYEKDFYKIPSDVIIYYDYNQGLNCAKQKGKPIFLTFTGFVSVSCRETLFENWFNNEEIHEILRKKFVVIALFVDDKSRLDSNDYYISEYSNKRIETIGKKNIDYQIKRFNSNAQPYSVVLDTNGNVLLEPLIYTPKDINKIEYMENGILKFKTTHNN